MKFIGLRSVSRAPSNPRDSRSKRSFGTPLTIGRVEKAMKGVGLVEKQPEVEPPDVGI